MPGLLVTRDAPGKHHRRLGALDQPGDLVDGCAIHSGAGRLDIPRRVGARNFARQFGFLHFGVEIDIDRPLGRAFGQPSPSQQCFPRGGGRGRLVVPFYVIAHQSALIGGGMNPVDPRAAFIGVHRSRGTQNHHRHAVAPSVEDRHGRVHQPHVGMDGRSHGLARDLGVTMGDRHRVFLMQAQQYFRIGIAQIIDQTVVQPAKAGARVERDKGNIEIVQCLGNDVRAETRRVVGYA